MFRCVWTAILLVACSGAASPQVAIQEMERGQLAHKSVGVGQLFSRQEFRHGKRVTIVRATILLNDPVHNVIQKHELAEGDELFVGNSRWRVTKIFLGDRDTRGGVLFEAAP